MSTRIVDDINPPPEWNLAEEDIHQMVDELEQSATLHLTEFVVACRGTAKASGAGSRNLG